MKKLHSASELVLASFDRFVHPENFGGFRFASVALGDIRVRLYLFDLGHQIVINDGRNCVTELFVPDPMLQGIEGTLKTCNFLDTNEFKYSFEQEFSFDSITQKRILADTEYSICCREVLFMPHKNRVVNWVSEQNKKYHSFSMGSPMVNGSNIVIKVNHLFGSEKTIFSSVSVVGKIND